MLRTLTTRTSQERDKKKNLLERPKKSHLERGEKSVHVFPHRSLVIYGPPSSCLWVSALFLGRRCHACVEQWEDSRWIGAVINIARTVFHPPPPPVWLPRKSTGSTKRSFSLLRMMIPPGQDPSKVHPRSYWLLTRTTRLRTGSHECVCTSWRGGGRAGGGKRCDMTASVWNRDLTLA